MKFIHWLRPGLKIKRWIIAGLTGAFLIFISLSHYLSDFFVASSIQTSLFIGLAGLYILFFSLKQIIISVLDFVYYPTTLTGRNGNNKLDKEYNKIYFITAGTQSSSNRRGTGLSVL